MIRILIAALLALAPNFAWADSTVDPTQPATNSALLSQVVRQNFSRAVTDLNNILGLFNGPSAPANPRLYQRWMNTSTSPAKLQIWNGSAWVDLTTYLNLPTLSNNYIPSYAGGVSRTIQNTFDNAQLSVTSFGAVGDGNIANAAANIAAVNAILATGHCAYFPYTAAGYNFGTNGITVSTSNCVIGENQVKIIYTGTVAPFQITAHSTEAFPARIEGFTFDMSTAASSATAIRNMTRSTPNGSVAAVRIRHIMCLNAYECIADEASPLPTWASGSAYSVGAQTQYLGFDYTLLYKSGGGTTSMAPFNGVPSSYTATVTAANPAVVTATGSGLYAGQPVKFSSTGTLPTGITAGTYYYALSSGLTGNTFQFSTVPAGSPVATTSTGTGTLSVTTYSGGPDGYVWSATAPNFTTDEEWYDIQALLTKGRQFYMRHTRGFIYIHDIRIDENEAAQQHPVTWSPARFEDLIGLEIGRYDHVGPAFDCNAPGPGNVCATTDYQANQNCIEVIGNNTANPIGIASVWILDRLLCDSASGNGPNFQHLGYVQAQDLETYGALGNGIVLYDVQDSHFNNILEFGGIGRTGAASGAFGVLCQVCNRVNINNLITHSNTGTGLSLVGSTNVNITNHQAFNNTGNAWALSDFYQVLNGVNTLTNKTGNVSINGGSVTSNGSFLADTSTGGGNKIMNVTGYNPQGALAVTVGASPFTYTAGLSPETVCVRGGTVSDVSGGIGTLSTIATATNVCPYLGPNESIRVTYSSTPAITTLRH